MIIYVGSGIGINTKSRKNGIIELYVSFKIYGIQKYGFG
jgi:hypothetical protein